MLLGCTRKFIALKLKIVSFKHRQYFHHNNHDNKSKQNTVFATTTTIIMSQRNRATDQGQKNNVDDSVINPPNILQGDQGVDSFTNNETTRDLERSSQFAALGAARQAVPVRRAAQQQQAAAEDYLIAPYLFVPRRGPSDLLVPPRRAPVQQQDTRPSSRDSPPSDAIRAMINDNRFPPLSTEYAATLGAARLAAPVRRPAQQQQTRPSIRDLGPPRDQQASQANSRGRRSGYAGVQKRGALPVAKNLAQRLPVDPHLAADAQKWRDLQAAKRKRPTNPGENITWRLCGNCSQPGHGVRDCVEPGDDGFVHGCPVCNSGDHDSPEGCKQFWPTRLGGKLRWAINNRVNRPTLAAFSDWLSLFVEAKTVRLIPLPEKFPWSPAFALELAEDGSEPWVKFDYAMNDDKELPADPVTRDQKTVLKHKDLLYKMDCLVTRPSGWPKDDKETMDVEDNSSWKWKDKPTPAEALEEAERFLRDEMD